MVSNYLECTLSVTAKCLPSLLDVGPELNDHGRKTTAILNKASHLHGVARWAFRLARD